METKHSFLFVTWEGGGNVPPVLGLASKLVKRGHRVRVLAEPCIESAVRESGAEYTAFQHYFTRTDSSIDLIKDSNARPLTVPAVENILVRPSLEVAKETIALLQAEKTDVVVADFMMIGSLFAAEKLEIKRVALFHMPEYLAGPGRPPGGLGLLPWGSPLGKVRDKVLAGVFNRVLNQYLPSANEARNTLGLVALKNLTDVFHQADLRLIQTCKEFDAPITPAPENVRYVGPVLDDPAWVEGETQSLMRYWAEGDVRPLIVVSLSSTYQNQASALHQIIKALSKVEARVLITLGPAMSKDLFNASDNIQVIDSVAHSLVFPFADMVITHAGHGTLMRSLAHGLPMVCMPMGRDQIDNATLLAHHGAGIKLSPGAQARTISKAVNKILQDSSFSHAAKKLQEKITADAELNVAESLLEELVIG